jgi:hypothetical protein
MGIAKLMVKRILQMKLYSVSRKSPIHTEADMEALGENFSSKLNIESVLVY